MGLAQPSCGSRTEKVFRRPSLVQMALRVSVLAFLGPVVGPRWVRATCALHSPSPGLCRAHACPAQSALSPSWPARSSRRPDVLPILMRACVWVFPGHARVLSKSVCGLYVPDPRLDTCCPYVEASAFNRRPPRRPDITYLVCVHSVHTVSCRTAFIAVLAVRLSTSHSSGQRCQRTLTTVHIFWLCLSD